MKKIVIATILVGAVVTGAVAVQSSDGANLFRTKCMMCHAIGGKGGTTGPDLTNSYSKLGPDGILKKMNYPKSGNPATRMPQFGGMSENSKNAIVEYLKR